jgi:surface protein
MFSLALSAQNPFVTIWDLSLDEGSGPNQVLFYANFNQEEVDYSWQELSPGNSSGSGQLGLKEGTSFLIPELPENAVIALSIASEHLTIFRANGKDSKRLIDIKAWGDAAWTDLHLAFNGCHNLNITATDIPDLSQTWRISQMFKDCHTLNGPQNIDMWDVSNVYLMEGVFYNALSFNQPIGSWHFPNSAYLTFFFQNATSFNQDISSWDVSNIINFYGMFYGASSFNQNIGIWDVNCPADGIAAMFKNATSFNQDIGGWDISCGPDISETFSGATSFNQDLSNWDVSEIRNFRGLFDGATSFDQDLSSWNIRGNVRLDHMLDHSGLSCENYDKFLTSLANNPQIIDSRELGAAGLNYWKADQARQTLINDYNWQIIGDTYSECNYISSTSHASILKEIQVFPNPTTNHFQLKVDQTVTLLIRNVNGQARRPPVELMEGSHIIRVDDLMPGIYALIFSNGQIEKLIIQR